MAAHVNAPGVNPAVDAAGTEGIDTNIHVEEGVTNMFSSECTECDFKLLSNDAEALADEVARHKDYHVYAAEFAAKNRRAYAPPPPASHIGATPGWDSTDPETGEMVRLWARPIHTSTLELGDSRGLVDIVREDRLAPEGIVPGVEAIQLAANYFDDQQRGSIHMTAAEARRVAQDLLAAADVFEQARHLIRDEDSIRAAADYRADV